MLDRRECNPGALVEVWEHALLELGRAAGYKGRLGAGTCSKINKWVWVNLGTHGVEGGDVPVVAAGGQFADVAEPPVEAMRSCLDE